MEKLRAFRVRRDNIAKYAMGILTFLKDNRSWINEDWHERGYRIVNKDNTLWFDARDLYNKYSRYNDLSIFNDKEVVNIKTLPYLQIRFSKFSVRLDVDILSHANSWVTDMRLHELMSSIKIVESLYNKSAEPYVKSCRQGDFIVGMWENYGSEDKNLSVLRKNIKSAELNNITDDELSNLYYAVKHADGSYTLFLKDRILDLK